MKSSIVFQLAITLLVLIATGCSIDGGGELPGPKNNSCGTCYIRIHHPIDRARYTAGRNLQIIDYDDQTSYALDEMWPDNVNFPILPYEDIVIPCGKRVVIKVWYYEKCDPPFDSDYDYYYKEYAYTYSVAPQACVEEVFAQPLFNWSKCP